jgi:endonuclease III
LAKSDSKQVKALNALLKKARSAWKGEEPVPLEPTPQLVLGFLTWNSTVKQAEGAFEKIMSHVVDLNEMRVSLHHEIVEMIGVRYPMAEERVIRMREAMFEVFAREHDWRMNSVKSKGKREQREYLDTLPGVPPYVAAQVALLCFGAHALPVDDKLAALLIQEGVAEPDTPPAELESWLLRQIKAGDALEAHLALQHWADGKKMPASRSPAKKTASKKATTKKAAAKKATKKKAAKKAPAKKTAKKKATRSRVAKKK